jgi:hypothetical protein
MEILEKFCKNKKEKKILLASKSEAHIEQINEKNRGQKILHYCPFKLRKKY